nr:xylulose kinase-1 [Tanacetum cinerariifolium]
MQNFISSSDLLCWNIVLKGNNAKSMTTDKDGNLKIRPPVTAKEHQLVQREEKARTILLSTLLDEHMGDFYHMIDARDIWNAIKERFDQQLICKDLDQMNKEEFKEYDLKQQMAMLSIRECRAQGVQNSNNYQKYKSKQAGKDESDSKDMLVVDGIIDWDKQTKGGNIEPRSLENFSIIAGIKIESDANSKGEVVSADDVIPAGVFVPVGTVAAAVVSPQSEIEFALMGVSTK